MVKYVFYFIIFIIWLIGMSFMLYKRLYLKRKIKDEVFYVTIFLSLFLISGLRSPNMLFLPKYRVDVVKEFSTLTKTYDKSYVDFTYQAISDTWFGNKLINLTIEQASALKVGDYVDRNGNKIDNNIDGIGGNSTNNSTVVVEASLVEESNK